MVIASGIVTSRISFSFGSLEACPFRRWVRRRNEAIERSRTSSALSAVTSVRRPRSFCGPGLWVVLGGTDGAHRAAGATPHLTRTFVFIGTVGGNARGARGRHDSRTGSSRRAGRRGGARCSGRRRRGRGLGLGLAKSLLGLDFGLALGFFFDPVAFFLGLAAGFGGLAFGLFDAFTAGAALGFFLGQPPFLDFAHLGVGQRAGAGGTLVFR